MLLPGALIQSEPEYRFPRLFIQTSGTPTGTAYAWSEYYQGSPGVFTLAPSGRSGTATSLPAYMADSSTTVPSGTICEAIIHFGGWLIAWPILSGGGSGGITSINDDATASQTIGLGIAGTQPNITTAGAAYSSSRLYSLGWIVTSGGVVYRYINATPTTGNAPPNATYWVVCTSDGFTIVNIPDSAIGARGLPNINTAVTQTLGTGRKRFTHPLTLGSLPSEFFGFVAELHLNEENSLANQQENFGHVFFGDKTTDSYAYLYGQGGFGAFEIGVYSYNLDSLSKASFTPGLVDSFGVTWDHVNFVIGGASQVGSNPAIDDPEPFFGIRVGGTVYPGATTTQAGMSFRGGLYISASYIVGDILYASTTTLLSALAIGTAGKLLTSNGTLPVWSDWDANGAVYNPSASLSWAGTPPTTIREALDRCAALLKALNAGTGP